MKWEDLSSDTKKVIIGILIFLDFIGLFLILIGITTGSNSSPFFIMGVCLVTIATSVALFRKRISWDMTGDHH